MRPVELSWIAAGCASTSPCLEHLSEPRSPQVCHTQRTTTDNKAEAGTPATQRLLQVQLMPGEKHQGIGCEYSLSPRGVLDRSLYLYIDAYTLLPRI